MYTVKPENRLQELKNKWNVEAAGLWSLLCTARVKERGGSYLVDQEGVLWSAETHNVALNPS